MKYEIRHREQPLDLFPDSIYAIWKIGEGNEERTDIGNKSAILHIIHTLRHVYRKSISVIDTTGQFPQ